MQLVEGNLENLESRAFPTAVIPKLLSTRGVAILIRNNFDCIVEEKVADAHGRFLILKVLLNGEQILLVNIYGPNRDNELVAFYLSLLQTIVKNDFHTIENIIMGGDFNCPCIKPHSGQTRWKPFPKAICS